MYAWIFLSAIIKARMEWQHHWPFALAVLAVWSDLRWRLEISTYLLSKHYAADVSMVYGHASIHIPHKGYTVYTLYT